VWPAQSPLPAWTPDAGARVRPSPPQATPLPTSYQSHIPLAREAAGVFSRFRHAETEAHHQLAICPGLCLYM
jgi:hypothetical protein